MAATSWSQSRALLEIQIHSTIHHRCHFRIHYYDFALVFTAMLFKLCPFFCQQVFPQTLLCSRCFLDLGDASVFKLSKIISLVVFCSPSNPQKPVGLYFLSLVGNKREFVVFLWDHPWKIGWLKLEIRSSCSQLTNHTFHHTRQDLWAGSSSGQSTLWIGACCICPWIWPSKGPLSNLSLRNDLPFSNSIKESQWDNRMRSKVLSLKCSFCVFEKEKKKKTICIYDLRRRYKMK